MVLRGIFLDVEQLAVPAVLDVHDASDGRRAQAEIQRLPEKVDLVQQWQRGAMVGDPLDCGAIRVLLAEPDAVNLIRGNELPRILEHCLVADVQRVRPAVGPAHDVLPLSHAVDRRQEGQTLLLQPHVRILGGLVFLAHSGERGHRAVPVRDRNHAAVHAATASCGDETAGDEGVGADAALPIGVLAALEGVIVGRTRLVDGAAVVGSEDHERVVPHPFRLHGINYSADGFVEVEDHRRVQPAVRGVERLCACVRHHLVDLRQVPVRHLQRRVHEVRREEEEQRLREVVLLDDL
mmetsp:Transcript_7688/g.20626  ORF Transcript_7688/g.20626 Transcript_7688/m.20626 type:complete len:294 (+) Transcript_7688:921-1802(+)